MQQLLTYMFGHLVCGVDIITSTFNYMLNGECIISVMSSQVSGYKCAAHNKKNWFLLPNSSQCGPAKVYY